MCTHCQSDIHKDTAVATHQTAQYNYLIHKVIEVSTYRLP